MTLPPLSSSRSPQRLLRTASRLLPIAAAIATTLVTASCHKEADDERIPYAEVHLTFHTIGDWNIHGVGGAGQSKPFILASDTRTPSDFPFTALDRTGYGGLLLCVDALGNTVAYDMACPVEARPTVRVYVPTGEAYAQCPGCGSTFDLYTNHGNPRSGQASEHAYPLRRYSVNWGGALDYLVVTR